MLQHSVADSHFGRHDGRLAQSAQDHFFRPLGAPSLLAYASGTIAANRSINVLADAVGSAINQPSTTGHASATGSTGVLNQCLAVGGTGDIRRFLVGPSGCEITGATATPDGRTLFISIQHPGESPSERSDPPAPRKVSNWPDQNPAGRPRSAPVVIRKNDGGVIGA